jgi:pimeloyl-ACP methyl ester carboxylesterase
VPVLLLHGYPQTHVMWHRVAPVLAQRFTVVCADLRGYGDSGAPASDATHEPYSKRAMAVDQLEVMQQLGHERFALVGHDRGARVARRLALDHPHAVSRLALVDIVPTATIYGTLDHTRATAVWRYFFLVQPPDLPERLIGADPVSTSGGPSVSGPAHRAYRTRPRSPNANAARQRHAVQSLGGDHVWTVLADGANVATRWANATAAPAYRQRRGVFRS